MLQCQALELVLFREANIAEGHQWLAGIISIIKSEVVGLDCRVGVLETMPRGRQGGGGALSQVTGVT